MEAIDLLEEGKIDRAEYHTYLLFEEIDHGRDYLKNMFEAVCMEEPDSFSSESPFAWQDGRRSVFRDIKRIINEVNIKLNIYEGN